MKPAPASYTNLRDFEQCPRKYEAKYILKNVPKEKSEVMDWGNKVHKAFEDNINTAKPFPAGMEKYAQFTAFPQGFKVVGEKSVAMKANGEATDFWDKEVWLRGKIDITIMSETADYAAALWDVKTGKRREDPLELEIQGLLLQARYPKLTRITGHYIWLQDMELGKQHDLSDTAGTFRWVKDTYDAIGHQLAMGFMPPRQGPLCGWCPVKSCEFHP